MRPAAKQRLQSSGRGRRDGEHGVAGGKHLDGLREQRLAIGAKRQHLAARQERERAARAVIDGARVRG